MIKKIQKRGGFTLAETLVAMLILLLVSAMLAQGIPTAINVYHKVTDAANAHILVSTTMTELRDKIGLSSEVEKNEGDFVFTADNGRIYILDNYKSATNINGVEHYGLYLRDVTGDGLDDSKLLVSDAAAAKNLYATFGSVNVNNGIVVFTDLEVFRKTGGNAIVKIDKYDVKVLNYQGE